MGKDDWVQPRDDGQWEVKKQGNDRTSSVHGTPGQAADAGKNAAQDERSDLIIKGRDGKIRSKDSYGNVPRSRRDREH